MVTSVYGASVGRLQASGTVTTNFKKPDLPEGDYVEVEAIWDVQLSRRARNALRTL